MNLPKLYAIIDIEFYKEDYLRPVENLTNKYSNKDIFFQIRWKNSKGKYFYEVAKKIKELTKDYIIFINERVDIAKALDLNVHLPSNSFKPSLVKNLLPDKLIGFSAHSKEEIEFAKNEGADFVTLSPIFPTESHKEAKPLGKDIIKDFKEIELPIFALGGIKKGEISSLLSIGFYGIASIRLFSDLG